MLFRSQIGEECRQDQKAGTCRREPESDCQRSQSGEIDYKRNYQQHKSDDPCHLLRSIEFHVDFLSLFTKHTFYSEHLVLYGSILQKTRLHVKRAFSFSGERPLLSLLFVRVSACRDAVPHKAEKLPFRIDHHRVRICLRDSLKSLQSGVGSRGVLFDKCRDCVIHPYD